jgi:ATP-dependent RNA circularization protein (DNA/RNA ligase family)
MPFERYQHIERFGVDEVRGIEYGTCFVFHKLDGTNSSVWMDGNTICAGSRNRQLSMESDNHGFYMSIIKNDYITKFLAHYPNLRMYGEFLIPHTLKTYDDSAWKKFYVFDVMDGERYLPYPEYQKLLDEWGIEHIPPICVIDNPTDERLYGLLDKNTYLIKDGCGFGEGIVIKNYDFKNKYGKTIWAKIVRNEFKASHAKIDALEMKEKNLVEQMIVDEYVTQSLCEKELAKIQSETEWTSKMIPRLLNTVYYSLVTEESWNFVKKYGNPTIDFKRLMGMTYAKVKTVLPNIF